MKILESKLVKDFSKLCNDGYYLGFHERNGGNLSYRLKESEVNDFKEEFDYSNSWNDIGITIDNLASMYFMVTGSGKYFRNVLEDFENNVCIIHLDKTASKYQIVWGLKSGGRPTSELPSHLLNLSVLKNRDEDIRIVYHCHPANIVSLTYVLPLEDEVFTREIWEMETECPVVFPSGIGVVKWMVPGGIEIGKATSEIMKTKNVAIWAHHGMFVCGKDFDEAFGLAHTVEKAAEILVKVKSMSNEKLNTITVEDFKQLEEPFNIKLDEKFLYQKKSKVIGSK